MPTPPSRVPQGTFVYASCPARIDLAGGWTDTILVSQDHGGRVVNVAVNVNQRAPYTVKARRTEALILSLCSDVSMTPIHYHSLEQIRDHADPLVPCALLKACIVASGILGITAMKHDTPYKTLAEVLSHSGGGLELTVQSTLPVGSGMGTSSILGAAILAVLKRLMGESATMDELLYLTLEVEQMMNTGGGWQDQLGGIFPGFKVGSCGAGYPLQLETKLINPPTEFMNEFNSKLLLIYTGQTRLAKNLLQTVLMNWSSQEPRIVESMDRLVHEAARCVAALEQGDMQTMGEILTGYFTDKRFLSNTTLESPPIVATLLRHLDPFIVGASLAGAGGGGFLAAVVKKEHDRETVVSTVRRAMALEKNAALDAASQSENDQAEELMWSWHASVDTQGLVVQVGKEC